MRTAISQITNQYIQTPSGRAVALELIMLLRTMERGLTEQTFTPELRNDVLRSFTTLLLDLPANVFWREHASYLLPIVATSVNAWIDSTRYAEKASIPEGTIPNEQAVEATLRFHGLRNTMVEVALAVVYCEQGAGGLRDVSFDMREKLIKVLQ